MAASKKSASPKAKTILRKKAGPDACMPGKDVTLMPLDTTSENTTDILLTITDEAAFQLKKLQKSMKKEGYGIRVEVSPGGCAGFQYFIDFEKEADERDIVFEEKGFKLHVDPVSADFLEGTSLDYEESLQASGFRFNNPNVSHACHCGKSVC